MNNKPNWFKGRREKLGLTQRAIALKLNITTTAVSQWELGIATPLPKMWDALAEVYGVSVSQVSTEVLKLIREPSHA